MLVSNPCENSSTAKYQEFFLSSSQYKLLSRCLVQNVILIPLKYKSVFRAEFRLFHQTLLVVHFAPSSRPFLYLGPSFSPTANNVINYILLTLLLGPLLYWRISSFM